MSNQQPTQASFHAEAPQQCDAAREHQPNVTSVAIDIEDDLFRAMALNDLARWVCKAQDFISSVRVAVEFEPTAEEALARRGVALYSPEWHSAQATGLEVLHMEVDEHLSAVQRLAGLAPDGSPPVVNAPAGREGVTQ